VGISIILQIFLIRYLQVRGRIAIYTSNPLEGNGWNQVASSNLRAMS